MVVGGRGPPFAARTNRACASVASSKKKWHLPPKTNMAAQIYVSVKRNRRNVVKNAPGFFFIRVKVFFFYYIFFIYDKWNDMKHVVVLNHISTINCLVSYVKFMGTLVWYTLLPKYPFSLVFFYIFVAYCSCFYKWIFLFLTFVGLLLD